MWRLFKIEWMKIKSYVAFKFLFGGFLILFILAFWTTAHQFMKQFSGKSMEEIVLKNLVGAPFVFPKVWQSASWMGGLFFIIIGMLFIILIANEFQYKTHRQNIIDGWDRMDFINAKLSVLLFFLLSSTALVFVSGLLIGLIYTPSGELGNIFEGSVYILYFMLMALVYLLVAFFTAIIIKRTGLSIVVYFGLVFVIDNLLWASLTFKGSQIGYFLPLESVDSLIPNPFAPKMLMKRNVPDWSLIAVAVAYSILFLYTLRKHFKKIDL